MSCDIWADIQMLDEMVHRVRPRTVARQFKGKGVEGIICLVGVQTNQFPHSADLAKEFRSLGLDVLIGGFHVSGSIAFSSNIPSKIQELIDLGVTVMAGEVEEHWAGILEDAARNRLRSFYNFLRA